MTERFNPRDNRLDVLPYRALLRSGRWEDRKSLVMSLYESGRTEASSVLAQALEDPDERIRLLAAQALERLSEKFEKSIQAERRRIDHRPQDPLPKVELAGLLYERASRSLHAVETERSTFAEAAALLNAAIPQLREPRLANARLLLGRVQAKLGQAAEACKTLALIPPDSPSFAEARFLMAEMWLAQGQIAACNEEMKALAKLPLKNGVKAAVSFWGAGR